MKVALAQLSSGPDWRSNLAKAEDFILRASKNSADVIFFPENMFYLGDPKRARKVAIDLRHEALRRIKQAAHRGGIAVLVGSYPELRPSQKKISNTSVFIDQRGVELARYRKIHMFDVTTPKGKKLKESAQVARGHELVTFTWRGIKMGMSICFDLRFPEHYRDLARGGAEWLLIPSAFEDETGKAHWHTLLRARAIENLATVIAPAQTGKHPMDRKTFGHSSIYDPWGTLLLDLGKKPGLKYVNIENGKTKQLRKVFPVF